MNGFLRRVWYLLRQSRRDAELREEIEAHRALHQARLERDGGPAGDVARQSHRLIGNLTLAREDVRGVWIPRTLDDLGQDLRLSARRLARRPVFTTVGILTFALGVGANTAVFSVTQALLWRQLAVPGANELLALVREGARERGESFSYPAFDYMQSHARGLGDLVGYATRFARARTNGLDIDAGIQLVSRGYFRVLQVAPSLGRTPDSVDDRDAVGVAVVSDAFWRRHLTPDVSPLGVSLSINGASYAVIGVMPAGFEGLSLDAPADIWLSMLAQPRIDGRSLLDAPASNWVRVIARVAGGMARVPAGEGARLAGEMRMASGGALDVARINLEPAARPASGAREALLAPLILITLIVGLTLCVACINIAYLLHARGAARAREFAIQAAIGASRGRVTRQLVTETVLLAILGGAAGIALAFGGTHALEAYLAGHTFGAFQAPRWIAMDVNLPTLAFTTALAVAAGILTGLAPARRASVADPIAALKSGPREAGDRRRAHRDRALVASQLALSFLLLAVAGTFIQSFRHLQQIDLGFQPESLVQGEVDWARSTRPPAHLLETAGDVLAALRLIPGVTAASVAAPGVFTSATYQTNIGLPHSGQSMAVSITSAAPGYFATLGIPVRGRDFNTDDRATSPRVVVLSESTARTLFPGADPIGRDVLLYGGPLIGRVVGVAADIRLRDVLAPPPILVYVPYLQTVGPAVEATTWTVRSRLPTDTLARQLERIVHDESPESTVTVRAVVDLIGQSVFLERATAWLTGLFGVLGVGLAIVGTYGLVSFNAQRRTPEVGLRLALGATPSEIRWQMCASSLKPILIGIGVGCAVSFAAIRAMSGYFQGLSAAAPEAVAWSILLLISTAAVACFVPALRASKSDPVRALRCE